MARLAEWRQRVRANGTRPARLSEWHQRVRANGTRPARLSEWRHRVRANGTRPAGPLHPGGVNNPPPRREYPMKPPSMYSLL